MGTGSFGGVGSGGGGGYSSRVDYNLALGYRFKNRKPIPSASNSTAVRKEIRRILKRISKPYIKRQFCSKLILLLYEELFNISQFLTSRNPCSKLAAKYGIRDGQSFLLRLVEIIIHKYQQSELNTKIRDLGRMCIEDFLIKSIGEDHELYLSGTCNQVIKKIDIKVFKSTSGYFLGNMIWRVLQREHERKQSNVEFQIKKESQVLGDKIINSFENQFVKKEDVTYRDLFRIIEKNFDWFIGELRK